jgi:tellurite resistance protein TehA-like permease
VTDDSQLAKRVAYVKTVRGLYRNERIAGLLGSLIGALLLIWGRMGQGAPGWVVPVAFLVIGAAWSLFAYVIIRRTRYVRAHPFDPQS